MAHTYAQEWLNANLSRSYPLADEVGGQTNTLPCTLLVDCRLIHDCHALYDAYISKLEVSEVGWIASLTFTAVQNDGDSPTEYTADRLIAVPYDTERNGKISFNQSIGTTGISIAGSVIIGKATAVAGLPSSNIYTLADTKLSPAVITSISGLCIKAIKVGDELFSGVVELVAGDGIELETSVDEATKVTTINITNTKYSPPEANQEITGDAALAKRLVALYGPPITSINGVTPDEGNIEISYPTASDDGVSLGVVVDNTGVGRLALTLTPDPCIDKEAITTLIGNLSQLNFRADKLDTGIKELDTAINTIATQMTRLS
jgi:hypothetical protein